MYLCNLIIIYGDGGEECYFKPDPNQVRIVG